MNAEKPEPMTLDRCVTAFLQIALTQPEKAPKTQRAQRENQMMIIGFNRAQETLRTILASHGQSKATQALAEVRDEKQQQPMELGGMKVWAA